MSWVGPVLWPENIEETKSLENLLTEIDSKSGKRYILENVEVGRNLKQGVWIKGHDRLSNKMIIILNKDILYTKQYTEEEKVRDTMRWPLRPHQQPGETDDETEINTIPDGPPNDGPVTAIYGIPTPPKTMRYTEDDTADFNADLKQELKNCDGAWIELLDDISAGRTVSKDKEEFEKKVKEMCEITSQIKDGDSFAVLGKVFDENGSELSNGLTVSVPRDNIGVPMYMDPTKELARKLNDKFVCNFFRPDFTSKQEDEKQREHERKQGSEMKRGILWSVLMTFLVIFFIGLIAYLIVSIGGWSPIK